MLKCYFNNQIAISIKKIILNFKTKNDNHFHKFIGLNVIN